MRGALTGRDRTDAMRLLLIGVSHRTSSLDLREPLALNVDGIVDLLARLTLGGAVQEAVVLSTCNRTEFYVAAPDLLAAERVIRKAVLEVKQRDLLAPGAHRNVESGVDVARHLFRVACGCGIL